MLETARLNGGSDGFELDFVEREATPESAMKLGIQLHLAGLSLSDTVTILEELGVDRCRTAVHNWVEKADLQPLDGVNPDHVAVDETVIQLNDEQYWRTLLSIRRRTACFTLDSTRRELPQSARCFSQNSERNIGR